MTISTDCGDFNGAIRAYSKLLDIHPKKNFQDVPVLRIITQGTITLFSIKTFIFKAIAENLSDYADKPARNELTRMKELLHKIVSAKPSFQEAWSCYAEIAMIDDPSQKDMLKVLSNRATVLQKAIRALMADKNWHLEESKCNQLCNIVQDLAIIGIRSEKSSNIH